MSSGYELWYIGWMMAQVFVRFCVDDMAGMWPW